MYPLSIPRKQLKLSQDDQTKQVGTSAPIIGRYERNEIKPSIDVAAKIADAFEVPMDCLVGDGLRVSFDKKILTACMILRSSTMLLKLNSTLLLITLCKF